MAAAISTMEEDLHALASYPAFHAFPLTKNFGIEQQSQTIFFPKERGKAVAHYQYLTSLTGASMSSFSFSSPSSFLTSAEFFRELAASHCSTPFYLYDEARLRANCRRLLTAFRTLRAPVRLPLASGVYPSDASDASVVEPHAISVTAATALSIPPVSAENAQSRIAANNKSLPSFSSAPVFSHLHASPSTVYLFKHFVNYFAVKATPTPAILQILYEEGMGVDCSTLAELLLAEATGFCGERIFFTSNCTSPAAYRKAYDLNAIINLDNPADMHWLRQYLGGNMPDILCLRYTPSGFDQAAAAALLTSSPCAAARNVTTASSAPITRASTGSAASQATTAASLTATTAWHSKGNETLRSTPGILGEWHNSKFGMTRTQVLMAAEQALRMGVTRIGLHSMTLSNTLDVDEVVASAACVFLLAKDLRELLGIHVEVVNLGGGLGVPYKPGQATLDLDAVAYKIQSCLLKVYCCDSSSSSSATSSSDSCVNSTLGSGCVGVGQLDDPLKKINSYSSCIGGATSTKSTAETNVVRPVLLPRVVMENGRFLTADTGVLVTRVTHLKRTYKNFIGVDACMANLMRPGLYGAYHHITVVPDRERRENYSHFFHPPVDCELPPGATGPVPPRRLKPAYSVVSAAQPEEAQNVIATPSPLAERAYQQYAATRGQETNSDRERGADVLLVYDVVGGLCENNDKFAVDRLLPRVEIGDLLLIHDVGAHGHSMGFNYNGHLRSAEFLRRLDGNIELIRRAEDFEDLFTTIFDQGLPGSSKLLRLARYYSAVELNNPQLMQFGISRANSGGDCTLSFLRAITGCMKKKLVGGSDVDYGDEEKHPCRSSATYRCYKSLLFSSGLIVAACITRLLMKK